MSNFIKIWLTGILNVYAFLGIMSYLHNTPFLGEYELIEKQRQELQQKKAEQQIEHQSIQDLNAEIDSLENVIKQTKCVTATIYYPTGNEMRSGKSIPYKYTRASHKPNYIAISQDLWDRNGGPYSFGDSLKITGTPFDGIYVVEDTMNKRHKKRVDILVSRKNKLNENWYNVKICKV